MAVYIVTYDLNTPGKNYNDLLSAIRRYTHCTALKSAFFIQSASGAAAIRDDLMRYVDGNDALYVIRFQGEWGANRKMPCTDWLQGQNF